MRKERPNWVCENMRTEWGNQLLSPGSIKNLFEQQAVASDHALAGLDAFQNGDLIALFRPELDFAPGKCAAALFHKDVMFIPAQKDGAGRNIQAGGVGRGK